MYQIVVKICKASVLKQEEEAFVLEFKMKLEKANFQDGSALRDVGTFAQNIFSMFSLVLVNFFFLLLRFKNVIKMV